MASRLNLHAHNRPFHFRIFQPVVLRARARQLKKKINKKLGVGGVGALGGLEIFITVNTVNSPK